MTRSSTYCLGCDAAVLPAGAVCTGAGADGLVIEEIASDQGLFLSKFERKLRGALRECHGLGSLLLFLLSQLTFAETLLLVLH
jgi:hypothetical protein